MSDGPSLFGEQTQRKAKPRHVKPQISCLSCGPLTLDMGAATVKKGERVINLTPKETQLLTAFMRHPGQILAHTLLIKEIWQTDFIDDIRLLHVHIRLLRKKIEDDPSHPVLIQTVRRRGYRFVSQESEE